MCCCGLWIALTHFIWLSGRLSDNCVVMGISYKSPLKIALSFGMFLHVPLREIDFGYGLVASNTNRLLQ
jgi:hypothetical protein